MASLGLLNLLSIGEYTVAAHQLSALLLGAVAMVPLVRMHTGSWWSFGRGIYALALTMLLAVATVGAHAYGARRWLGVGAMIIQPSELAKVGVLLVLAHLLGTPSARPRVLMALVLAAIPTRLSLRAGPQHRRPAQRVAAPSHGAGASAHAPCGVTAPRCSPPGASRRARAATVPSWGGCTRSSAPVRILRRCGRCCRRTSPLPREGWRGRRRRPPPPPRPVPAGER